MKYKEKIRSEVLKAARRSRKLLKKEEKVTKQSAVKPSPISRERTPTGANSRKSLRVQ